MRDPWRLPALSRIEPTLPKQQRQCTGVLLTIQLKDQTCTCLTGANCSGTVPNAVFLNNQQLLCRVHPLRAGECQQSHTCQCSYALIILLHKSSPPPHPHPSLPTPIIAIHFLWWDKSGIKEACQTYLDVQYMENLEALEGTHIVIPQKKKKKEHWLQCCKKSHLHLDLPTSSVQLLVSEVVPSNGLLWD